MGLNSPFRITFELKAPVLVNPSISLDGILAHQTYRRTGDAENAHHELPLRSSDGIYQASEIHFLGPVFRRQVQFVLNGRWERFAYGDLGGRRGTPVNKITAREQYKPTLDAYDSIAARTAFAFGSGDIDSITMLLDGLDAIGKKSRSTDFGRVARISVEAVHSAPELIGFTDFTGTNPGRVVPEELWRGLGLSTDDISIGPARPNLPRWATEDVLCVLPRSRIVEMHEVRRIGL